MPKLVYIRGMFGTVEAQIWHDDSVVRGGSGNKKVDILQEHSLEEWEAKNLTVSELEDYYPYKESKDA